MVLINGISAYPTQTLSIASPNGDGDISFTLRYQARTSSWNCDISFGDDFVVNGLKLVMNPNILYQFHNNISFGLMVKSVDGYDPMFVNDFISDGRCELYLLTSDEITTIQDYILENSAS